MHIKGLNEREVLDIKCTLQSTDDWQDWTGHTGEARRESGTVQALNRTCNSMRLITLYSRDIASQTKP